MTLTNEELDALRTQGDDILDPLIASLGAAPGALGEMLGALFRTDRLPVDDARFAPLLKELAPISLEHPERIEEGQRLFQLYGPEVLLILGSYALPAAYAAANGAQVIYRSRRLKDDATRRLCETAQMVLNVMQPGGLAPDGPGTDSALKVRLMHGLVRRHVQTLASPTRWSPAFGVPINQEDLAGTLLTFSLVVLDGLAKIGVELRPAEVSGYFEVWRHVGALLGIRADLAAPTLEDAKTLALLIGRRQLRASPEGQTLARELAVTVDALFPVRGYGISLMHFFLDGSVFGDLTDLLGLPPPNWTMKLVRARAAQKRFVLRWLNRVPGARARRRVMARAFAQNLIRSQRPDKVMPFAVPPSLLERWGIASSG